MLLEAQVHVRRNGPPAVRELDLISLDELKEIRRIWVVDKHELEDILPKIYEQATGGVYPEKTLDDNLILKEKEMQKLEAICGEDRMHYELIRELLSRTRQQRSSGKRANIIEQLEKSFQRHFFENKEDAIMRATKRTEKRNSLKKRKEEQGMEMKEVNSLLSGDLL
jgi:DNA sulfur modification protein DndC